MKNNSQITFFYDKQDPKKIRKITIGIDKIIIIIIIFILTATSIYIVGVNIGIKKGLKTAGFDKTKESKKVNILQITKNKPKQKTPKEKQAGRKQTGQKKYYYTIQLASYKNKNAAQREAKVLRKQNIEAFILEKGEYIVLYAGKFFKKEPAEKLFLKLKRKYKDCLMRRLSI